MRQKVKINKSEIENNRNSINYNNNHNYPTKEHNQFIVSHA